MTDKGRLIARNYMTYRYIENKIDENRSEDYAFEITLPEGYKADNVWQANKRGENMWLDTYYVTGHKEDDGTKKTFI